MSRFVGKQRKISENLKNKNKNAMEGRPGDDSVCEKERTCLVNCPFPVFLNDLAKSEQAKKKYNK